MGTLYGYTNEDVWVAPFEELQSADVKDGSGCGTEGEFCFLGAPAFCHPISHPSVTQWEDNQMLSSHQSVNDWRSKELLLREETRKGC